MVYRTTLPFSLRIAGKCDVGPQRQHNEDAFSLFIPGRNEGGRGACIHKDNLTFVGDLPAAPGLFVATLDGMGGQSTGGWACMWTTAMLTDHLTTAPPVERAKRTEWLSQTMTAASEHVMKEGKRRGGQGCTAVFAWFSGTELYVSHVGDVRAYRFRSGRLEQLTEDHSLVNDARKHGMSEDQIEQLPRNVVTQCLGLSQTLNPETQTQDLQEGDLFLFSTDGLHEELENATIASVLSTQNDPQEACTTLVTLAEKAGGRDNITVVVVRVDSPEGAA